jgi:hypothetical protein
VRKREILCEGGGQLVYDKIVGERGKVENICGLGTGDN